MDHHDQVVLGIARHVRHHRFPRLRLELKSTVSWREDMEVALERLLGSMAPEPAFRPV